MEESIFIDENIPYLPVIIRQKYKVITFSGRKISNQNLIDANCIALFVRSTTPVNRELLSGSSVKFVATATSGSNHIDKAYLQQNCIQFADALGSNSNSVAEFVIYSILLDAHLRKAQVRGLTIGIIGFGNIGKKLAKYSNELGMKVLVNDPPLKNSDFNFPDYCDYREIKDLVEASNIISNHVPLIHEGKYKTINLFNENILNSIKTDSLFIHCSRGGVVNEQHLAQELSSKPNCRLVIDVYDTEPIANKALAERAIIATPHIAGYSKNGKLNGVKMVLDKFEKSFANKFEKSFIDNEYKESCFRGEFVSEEFIFQKIDEYRKISSDSATFKANICHSNLENAVIFDKLRKEYPIRFEYLNFNNL